MIHELTFQVDNNFKDIKDESKINSLLVRSGSLRLLFMAIKERERNVHVAQLVRARN